MSKNKKFISTFLTLCMSFSFFNVSDIYADELKTESLEQSNNLKEELESNKEAIDSTEENNTDKQLQNKDSDLEETENLNAQVIDNNEGQESISDDNMLNDDSKTLNENKNEEEFEDKNEESEDEEEEFEESVESYGGAWGNSTYSWDSSNQCDIKGVTFERNADKQTATICFASSDTDEELVLPYKVRVGRKSYAVTAIEDGAIDGTVRKVYIPRSVESLTAEAFSWASKLTRISVENTNKKFSSDGRVLYNKDKTTLIKYPNAYTIESFTVPSNVKIIDSYAFSYSRNLQNLILSDGVETLKNYMCWDSRSIKSIYLSSTVKNIGNNALYSGSIERIDVDKSNPYYTSIDGVLYTKDMSTLVQFPYGKSADSYVVPSTVNKIISGNLTGAVIWTTREKYNQLGNKGVTLIESNLYNRYNYISADPIKIKADYVRCFKYNNGQSVEIPMIKNNQGYYVHDPSRLQAGTNQYYYIATINGKTYKSDTISVQVSQVNNLYTVNNITYEKKSNNTLTIKQCSPSLSGEVILPDIITINGSNYKVVGIEDNALNGCSKITKLNISNGITYIGNTAFNNCKNLQSVTIPSTINSIKNNVFNGCSSLKNISVDRNNNYYTSDANGLFNKGKTTFLYYLKANKNSNYSIPSSVTSIGNYAFNQCNNLSNIILPKSISYIGDYVFDNCDNLKAIWLSNDAKSNFISKIPASVQCIDSNLYNRENYKDDIIKIKADSVKCFERCSDGIKKEVVLKKDSEGYFVHDPSRIEAGTKYYSYEAVIDGVTYESPEISVQVDPANVLNSWNNNLYTKDNITYLRTSDNTVSITNYENNNKEVIIPSSIVVEEKVYKVNAIDNNAFLSCTDLEKVTIPDCILNIGNTAFDNCSSLKEIVVDSNNASYSSEDGILFNKNKTKLIKFPQNKYIDLYVLPENVMEIDSNAFEGCTNVKAIYLTENQYDKFKNVIGNDVKVISHNLSENNKIYVRNTKAEEFKAVGENVKWFVKNSDNTVTEIPESKNENGYSILIPSTEQAITKEYYFTSTIGDYTYTSPSVTVEITESWNNNEYNESGISYIRTSDNTVTIKSCDLDGQAVLPSSITIDGVNYNVTEINNDALYQCDKITSLDIQCPIVSLNSELIEGCTNLTKLILPSSIENIDNKVFDALEAIEINEGNAVYSSEDGILFSKDKSKLIAYPKNKKDTAYVVPGSVKEIGIDAFRGNSNLYNILIKDNVESIDSTAFLGCDDLIFSVTDERIKNILTNNGISADNILSYEWDAENKCTINGIKYLKNDDDIVTIEGYDSDTLKSNAILAGKVIVGGRLYNVTSIKDKAFNNCNTLEFVTIGNGIENIGEWAFTECHNLKTVDVADSVTSIDEGAFALCDKLEDVKLSDNLSKLNQYNFNGCSSLEKLQLPENLKEIESCAVINCSNLKEIYIPDSVEIIEQGAFMNLNENVVFYVKNKALEILLNNCGVDSKHIATEEWNKDNQCSIDNVKYQLNDDNSVSIIGYNSELRGDLTLNSEIKVGQNKYLVKNISENAFSNSNIENLTIKGINKVDDWAFSGCKNLKRADLSEGVTSIGSGAFTVCESLEEVKLSDDLTKIGGLAFNKCISLEKIQISNSMITIETHVFLNCINLKSIIIPSEVKEIQIGAFTNFNDKAVFYVEDAVMEDKLNNAGVDSIYISTEKWNKANECTVNDIKYKKLNNNTVSIIGYNPSLKGDINLNGEITVDGIEYSVVSLEDNAFNKSDIESITLPETITSIGDWVFTECISLKKLVIPDSVTSVGNGLCSLCDKLEEVRLSNSLDTIPSLSFNKCESLENIEIPQSVTKIDSYAFIGCTNLKEIRIFGDITNIEKGCLDGINNEVMFITSSDITRNTLIDYGISEDKIIVQ